jgi:glycosyltransferase involved in cell wall biosynthesis
MTAAVAARKARTALRILRRALGNRLALRIPWTRAGRLRALFVADAEGATFHYRVQNQIEQLQIAGVDAAACHPALLPIAGALDGVRLLVLYRLDDTPATRRILALARARGIPVVCDTDDLTWDMRMIEYCALEQYYGPEGLAPFRAKITRERALLGHADAFIASTEYLAGLLRRDFGRPTFVNENAIARASIDSSAPLLAARARRSPPPRPAVGYFSGWAKAHEIDLAAASAGLLRALHGLPGWRLRVAGHFDLTSLPEQLRARAEAAPFVPLDQLPSTIAQVEINLAPLADNPHRRSKSAIKVLEAALVGVPTVASAMEPYDLIRHGETGYRASDAEQWSASIMALAADPALRGRIGLAAREQALAEHTTAARAARLASIVRELTG